MRSSRAHPKVEVPNQMNSMEGVQAISLSLGYVMAQSMAAAAKLGVPDALADGPCSVEELAARTDSHGPSLSRLLRTLAGGGVVEQDSTGRYVNSSLGDTLREGTPGSVRDAVIWVCEPMHYATCGELATSVRTGTLAFEHIFERPYFEWLAANPDAARVWDRGMSCFSSMEDGPIASACRFPAGATVVDVGGGQGGFLAEVLRADPSLRAILFDRADVLADPRALRQGDLDGRYHTVAGDFFESVPAGGDVYIYKRVLHDWDDERCAILLARCREAMSPNARLLVIDAVIPPGTDAHPAKIVDMVMLGILPGRERTEPEFASLLACSGFALRGVTPTHSMLAVIEAAPV